MFKRIISGLVCVIVISALCIAYASSQWNYGTNDQLFTSVKCSYSEYVNSDVDHYSGAKNSNGWVFSNYVSSGSWAQAYTYGDWNRYNTRVAYSIHYDVTTDIISGGA